ncbi:unnamed protein product [Chondrus crispus]|uniref:Uncharacterized protein n=1 Tax=Chondrus crispus TaxID=2769 RepID=R7QJV8_CHOCR|nr:unnamed protein product [Chondrus crispus]CDF38374.1 unnamed protein product [Chondrus crispus]|eukprot:XP_005718259.1 unnamed protein product [Chondrus crispus]
MSRDKPIPNGVTSLDRGRSATSYFVCHIAIANCAFCNALALFFSQDIHVRPLQCSMCFSPNTRSYSLPQLSTDIFPLSVLPTTFSPRKPYSRSYKGVFFGTPGNLGNARGVAFTFLTATIHFFLPSTSSASSPCPCIHFYGHASRTLSSFPPSLLTASFAAAISSAPAPTLFCANNTPPTFASSTHSSQQPRISANDRATTASYRPRCILLCPTSSALRHTDVTLPRASSRPTMSWKRVFLRAASSSVTSHCGLAMARTRPGNPAPVPTSTTRSPVAAAAAAASASSAGSRQSPSMTCLSSTASRVRIAVRLYRLLSLSSRSVSRTRVLSRATSRPCAWAARRGTACVVVMFCCVAQPRSATRRSGRGPACGWQHVTRAPSRRRDGESDAAGGEPRSHADGAVGGRLRDGLNWATDGFW